MTDFTGPLSVSNKAILLLAKFFCLSAFVHSDVEAKAEKEQNVVSDKATSKGDFIRSIHNISRIKNISQYM